MLKIGLLGAGNHARALALPLHKNGYQIASVYAPDARAGKLAAEINATMASAAQDLIDAPDITHVIIASPTSTHIEYIGKLLKTSKKILCATPTVDSPASLSELERIIRQHPNQLQLSLPALFSPECKRGRDAAREDLGKLGTIRLAAATPPPANLTGQVSLELGARLLGYLASFHNGEITSIFGMQNQGGQKEYCLATARLADGTIAHLELSWAESQGSYESYEITGTNGLIEFDSRTEPVYQFTSENLSEVIPMNDSPAYLEAKSWLDREQADNEAKRYVIQGLKAAFALAESLNLNQPYEIAPLETN